MLFMDLLNHYFATIFGGFFALLIFLYIISQKRSRIPKIRAAPEPVGAWPIIGHLPMLLGPRLPHTVLGNLGEKYGSAFTLRLGIHKALVVSSWEVAKECFTTNDQVFATRPSFKAAKILGYNYALFGLARYGSYWRELRKISMIELLSNHRLELLKHVRVSEVSTSIKELYEVWTENCSNGNGSVLVEMQRWFGDLTLNISVRMVAGKRYFGTSSILDDEARRISQATKDFFRLAGMFVVSDFVPFLFGWLDFQGHEKAMKRTAKEVDYILGGWLEEHRRNKLGGGTKVQQDFMDVMLSILEDEKFFGYNADAVTKATCLLLHYISAPHEAIKDCTIAGYHIPAGTRLITNIWKIQRDPRVWSNPSEFQPERFLTDQANVDVRGQHFELIPFGSGRRSSPGISLGLLVVHLAYISTFATRL
ncbi:hypothetical protein IFM89_014345 [Coptis chinensis]|uniref:Cytochrome P450 n=1 Tax=Coptis chinensis TaxID=261450 RepID=A0A835MEF1_9MAGN|nr:hypothetical protein IFM89_014345 [Coptis chinensis]